MILVSYFSVEYKQGKKKKHNNKQTPKQNKNKTPKNPESEHKNQNHSYGILSQKQMKLGLIIPFLLGDFSTCISTNIIICPNTRRCGYIVSPNSSLALQIILQMANFLQCKNTIVYCNWWSYSIGSLAGGN